MPSPPVFKSITCLFSLRPVMKLLLDTIRSFFLYAIMTIGIILMLRIISAYVGFDSHAGFLAFKQDYLHITTWKIAFYIHVFASIFTLIAGFTQFSDFLLQKQRALHRWIGKAYVFNILFINFPSALIMAVYANGQLPSKIAFVTLDVLWFYFTYKAYTEIRKKQVLAHEEFMIRSYALTCTALTLRLWKMILTSTTDLDPNTIYMIDAWLGFVPNLLVAEILIYRKRIVRNHLPNPTK